MKACLPNDLRLARPGDTQLRAAPRKALCLWREQLRRGLGSATPRTTMLAHNQLEMPSGPQEPSACQRGCPFGEPDRWRKHVLGGAPSRSSHPEGESFQPRPSGLDSGGPPWSFHPASSPPGQAESMNRVPTQFHALILRGLQLYWHSLSSLHKPTPAPYSTWGAPKR